MKLDRRLHRTSRGLHALLGTLGLALGGATVGFAYALASVVDAVFIRETQIDQVYPWLFGVVGFGLTRAGLRYAVDGTGEWLAWRERTKLRRALLTHLGALGPAWTEGARAGEIATTISEGVDALRAYYAHFLPQLYLAAAIPLTLLVVVFPRDLYAGAIFAFTAPLIPVFMVFIGEHAKKRVEAQFSELGRMASFFLEVLGALPTLKAIGAANAQLREVERTSRAYGEANMAVLRVAFVSALALELLATLSVALVAVAIGLRLVRGDSAYFDGLFVLILAPDYYQPLRALGASFHASMSGVEAAKHIFGLLDLPAPPTSGDVPAPDGGIVLHGLGFRYPGSDKNALSNVHLTVLPGTTLALVGASGSGKTTLTRIVLGLLTPTEGRLEIGGIPAEDIDPAAWRAQLGWVPQEPHFFAGSIADNVRLGAPDAADDALWRALEDAELADTVRALPIGLETPVGEGGLGLSGGQAQRLALARALLSAPSILILDEFTASLDPWTEARIIARMHELCKGRTVLMAAHRLSTARAADQIAVLHHGEVVELGSHDALMAQGGAYAALVRASEALR